MKKFLTLIISIVITACYNEPPKDDIEGSWLSGCIIAALSGPSEPPGPIDEGVWAAASLNVHKGNFEMHVEAFTDSSCTNSSGTESLTGSYILGDQFKNKDQKLLRTIAIEAENQSSPLSGELSYYIENDALFITAGPSELAFLSDTDNTPYLTLFRASN